MVMISTPAKASEIRESMSNDSSALCNSRAVDRVAGRSGTRKEQQSKCGRIEVSNDPMRRAVLMISCLSREINGRKMGTWAMDSTAARFSIVWEATWPRLSPVTSAGALNREARR